jgi:hypothetical protein
LKNISMMLGTTDEISGMFSSIAITRLITQHALISSFLSRYNYRHLPITRQKISRQVTFYPP